MPQIKPLEAGQALALALEDATGEMNLRNTEAEQRRAIYALCASCSDVEAGDVVRAIARTLYQAGVRESADDEVRVRLASPVLFVAPAPSEAAPPSAPANDGARSPSSTLPPPPPGVA